MRSMLCLALHFDIVGFISPKVAFVRSFPPCMLSTWAWFKKCPRTHLNVPLFHETTVLACLLPLAWLFYSFLHVDLAVKQFRPNPANTSVYKCGNTQTAQWNPFVSLAPEKPILNCQYNPNLIQYPEGGKKGAWWSPERWEIFNSLFCIWLDPELQLWCLFAAAPANGVRQRGATLEMERVLLQEAEDTSHFRAGSQSRRRVKAGGAALTTLKDLSKVSKVTKIPPLDAFIPQSSQKREPTHCPSLPAHPFGVKFWAGAEQLQLYTSFCFVVLASPRSR